MFSDLEWDGEPVDQYVMVGVSELEPEKLTQSLKLRYHDSIPDALADLGPAPEVRGIFLGFQQTLYNNPPTASP